MNRTRRSILAVPFALAASRVVASENAGMPDDTGLFQKVLPPSYGAKPFKTTLALSIQVPTQQDLGITKEGVTLVENPAAVKFEVSCSVPGCKDFTIAVQNPSEHIASLAGRYQFNEQFAGHFSSRLRLKCGNWQCRVFVFANTAEAILYSSALAGFQGCTYSEA